MLIMVARISPYPIPELKEFLRPFRPHFYRCESLPVLERYATGLLADIARKSGAGIAEAVAGLSESAVYRLLAQSTWDEAAVNRQRISVMVRQATAGDGMLVFDETSFPRQGPKSVGVAHQYCGALGKTANCQVVVTAHYIDPYYAWPALGQLYLPEAWCQDPARRAAARVPAQLNFHTKPALALLLLDQAQAAGIPFALVGADAGYGDNPNFLDGLDQRQMGCVVGIASDFGVRLLAEVNAAVARPLPSKQKAGRPRRHPQPVPVAPLQRADAVLASQPESAWHTITWRMGSTGPLTKQFSALRVRRGHADQTGPEGWLIGERPLPEQEGEPKFYWSNLPATTPLARLAELAHRRPGIERGYQDGKAQTGLGDYAARLWPSFHRQLTIEMLVHSWLLLQQSPPATTEIALDPRPVQAPDEPVFPLRPAPVRQRGRRAASGLRILAQRTDPLVGPKRPNRHHGAGWPAPPAGWRSFRQYRHLTIKTMQ
jgi:SRSO17 transposase